MMIISEVKRTHSLQVNKVRFVFLLWNVQIAFQGEKFIHLSKQEANGIPEVLSQSK